MNEADYVIAYPGDRPPLLCPRPCDDRGQLWKYVEATPQNAAEALDIHEREFPDWGVDPELVVLAGRVNVPTRADHEREAREELARLTQGYSWVSRVEREYIAQRVAEQARVRHEARVAYAGWACLAAVERLWPGEELPMALFTSAVAILALHGQGGPGDLGGSAGASALPLLHAPVFRHHRRSGPAWCAALAAVADGTFLAVDCLGPKIMIESSDGQEHCLLWSPDVNLHVEVRAALRRIILRLHEDVRGEPSRVLWRGWPEDYQEFARLRTALALLVCPPVAPTQVAGAAKEDRDGE